MADDWASVEDDWQPAGPATRETPQGGTLTDTLKQGATFGLSDEVGAAGGTVGDFLGSMITGKPFVWGESYTANLARQRGNLAAVRERMPVASTVTEIAGALPTALSAAPKMAASTLMGRIMQGGAVGAGQAGVYGINTGEGGAQNRATNAAKSATVGGLVGMAAPAVGAGVRNVAERVMAGRNATQLGMPKAAYNTLMRAGAADDTLTGAGAQRIQRGGSDAMLAEAGPNMRTLLDTAMQRSGPAATQARKAIEQRATGAAQSLNQTLDDVLGRPQGITRTSTALRKGTAAARGSAYDAAYAQPIDYASEIGRRIENVVSGRVPMSAIRRANQLMRVEGLKSQQILASVADDGTVTFKRLPDVRQLDYITRGLQDVADAASGQGKLGGTTDIGRAYGNLKTELRNLVREAAPAYREALETAADPISKRAALKIGKDALSARIARDEFAEQIAGMTGPERSFVAQGIRSQLDDAVSNVRRAMTDGNMDAREAIKAVQTLTTRANREKLQMLLGEEQSATLFDNIDQALSAFEIRAAVADNSRTFARLSMDDAIRSQTDEGVINALRSGEPVDATRRIAQMIGGRTAADKERIADETYSAIVKALTEPRGVAALNQLRMMGNMQLTTQPAIDQARMLAEQMMRSNAGVTAPLVSRP